MLSRKKILLGITGSIAAYKSLQIVRDLTASEAEVQVVLTPTAHRFVPPLTLQIFSGRPVLADLFDPKNEMAHLSLAQEADLILIAPVTAHFISKMAMGLADDLLSALLLATSAPILIAPAMDIGMWEHITVQENISRLKTRGVKVIEPVAGLLASGRVGVGRMADEGKIVEQVSSLLSESSPSLEGETVLVTAGPTQEPIDPVRFISNRSSGKMGYALAAIAQERGAQVTLVSGPTALSAPPGVSLVSVRTANEMKKEVDRALSEATIVLMAAAVSDYRTNQTLKNKRKKAGAHSWRLTLEETEDILLTRPKGSANQIVVGFAAETENLIENALKKLQQKRLDLIVANDVTEAGAGFDVETNIVHLIDSSGKVTSLPRMRKDRVARRILEKVVELVESV